LGLLFSLRVRLLKTNKTISIDVDVAKALESRPVGYMSSVCNTSLREALKVPMTEKQKARMEKNNPKRLWVPSIGWVEK